jgi:putative serine protease PepD
MNDSASIEGASGRRRRRAALILAPFVAGAATAAAVAAGVGGFSDHGASSTATASTSSANVASTASSFDAQTIYTRDSPGVVDITVTQAATSQGGNGVSPFGPGSGSQQAQAEGTGFVYDKQGNIITAAHVVSDASKITVRFTDGTTAKATLVGSDPSTDTAVIKVSVAAGKLTPLTLANSSAVEPGEGVVAIGSPFGYAESITAGIVSAVDRDIEAPNGYTIPNAIQTDAPINHGNSGGPLIDSSGNVVGVNVQIATDSQNGSSINAGVGFAVPSNTVKSVVTDLIAGKTVEHAYLGVTVGDNASGSGAQIGTVRAGSPAAAAGLKSGDVITAVDGVTIENANQLTAAVSGHRPGDELRLTVTRNGSTVQLKATLATRPATTTA